MKLTEAMNLVVPVGEFQAYHVPVSREVFEANYRVLASTRAALSSEGIMYQMGSGPQIAALALKDSARRHAEERGDVDDKGRGNDQSALALLAEVKRLTVIFCPTPQGWDQLPVDAAISNGFVDAEDWREAESAIVFFTCLFWLTPKAERQKMAAATAGLLKGSITSSPPSEFAASLPSSTPAQTSPVAASSVPS